MGGDKVTELERSGEGGEINFGALRDLVAVMAALIIVKQSLLPFTFPICRAGLDFQRNGSGHYFALDGGASAGRI